MDQGGPPADPMGRLADVLERLVAAPRAAHREEYKAPHFTGESDVEYFISQFEDVADANQWDQEATWMHLREALREGARDCGQAATVRGIYAGLRARYGLTPREARNRLNNLRKEYRTPLAEHASEVKKMVERAYGDLPRENQEQMILEHFLNTLDNSYLQRHLLAVDPQTLEEAVRAASEWQQIKPYYSGSAMADPGRPGPTSRVTQGRPRPTYRPTSGRPGPTSQWPPLRPNVRVVEEGEESYMEESEAKPENEVNAVQACFDESKLTQIMEQMAKQLAVMTSLLMKQQASSPSVSTAPKNSSDAKWVCWGCGQQGHTKRYCPKNPWTQRGPQRPTGNAPGPQ